MAAAITTGRDWAKNGVGGVLPPVRSIPSHVAYPLLCHAAERQRQEH
jgi:hypothetical protein